MSLKILNGQCFKNRRTRSGKIIPKITVDKFTRDALFKTAQKIYTKEMIKFKGV